MAESRAKQFRAIKGTRDILPPDSALWNWIEQAAREVFGRYGFHDIRTPIFEETALFARSIGTETDVVSKEMYTFADAPRETLEIPIDIGARVRRVIADFERGEIPQIASNRFLIGQLRNAIPDLEQDEKGVRESTSSIEAKTMQEKWSEIVGSRIAPCLNGITLGVSVALRPEATASVCRAYIEHGMHTLPGNVKLYYIGPMFRRERPQKGRYRQFYQIGVELLESASRGGASGEWRVASGEKKPEQGGVPNEIAKDARIDAEVIEMLLAFFARAGLTGTTPATAVKLYVNSIGDKNCRPKYVEELRGALQKVKDRLGPDSQRRIETNPLRVLDSKLPEEQAAIEGLPRIADHLCEECRAHFAKLKEELALRGIAYQENWRLVRGLDYYTRTTFEVTAPGLGSQNAVCGGGRYDGLVELLGGPPTKGIGFAIGTDRLVLSIQESGRGPKLEGLDVFVAWMGKEAYPAAVGIARKLRAAGFAVELPAEEMKFKKSLGLADKLGARYALILGGDEVASQTYTLKRLSDAQQKKLSEGELIRELKNAAAINSKEDTRA